MFLNRLTLNIILFMLILSAVYSSEDDFRLDGRSDHKVIAKKIRAEFTAHQGLLHQARGQHIVAFLGNTGAGKSTLINFLAGKSMTRRDGDVVLSDPNDSEAMAIGLGGESETLYPKAIKVGDLLFYDLPGFCDTKGSVRNLINAAFIRQILTEASSVRLVITASLDEFTSARGEAFKRMLNSVQKLFDIQSTDVFRSHSVLVITKSRCTNPNDAADYLLRKSTKDYQEILKVWTGNNRFCHMCHADAGADWSYEQSTIMQLISQSSSGVCGKVDISAIYPIETTSFLERIFYTVMEEKCDGYFAGLSSLSKLDEGISYLKTRKREFWSIIDAQTSGEEAVMLLRPFCETPYKTALVNIERDKNSRVQQLERDLNKRKEDRKRSLGLKCQELLSAAVEEYNEAKDEPARILASLTPQFHKYVYDAVLGDSVLSSLTGGDAQENRVMHEEWVAFTERYRDQQLNSLSVLYENAKTQATGGLWRR